MKLTLLQTFHEYLGDLGDQTEVVSVQMKLKRKDDWLLCQGVYRSPSATTENLRELQWKYCNKERDIINKTFHIF